MKPLTLEEVKLKEEMKERCLAKGQYVDENAKAKFEMLCHLEDFEVQYWELQKENQELKSQLKGTTHCFDEEEHRKLKDEIKKLERIIELCHLDAKETLATINYEQESQQKEFIEYMNKTIEELECDDADDEEMKGYLIQRIDTFKEILSKFKEIIRVSDEKK